jgi:hypothetical protein
MSQQTNRMNIAQIAPLTESVPPRLYGGTERIISHPTEELVREGHVPEVIEEGIRYFVESNEEAVCKIGRLLALDRGSVPRRFLARFTAVRMAGDYIKVYQNRLATSMPSTRERLPLLACVGNVA